MTKSEKLLKDAKNICATGHSSGKCEISPYTEQAILDYLDNKISQEELEKIILSQYI